MAGGKFEGYLCEPFRIYFNRYVGDFLQEKPEIWFIKMLRNQFGEFSYYLNHIVFKIKNVDFWEAMFRVLIFLTSISVSQTAGLHASNEHGEKSINYISIRAMVMANGHSDKLYCALSIRHFRKILFVLFCLFIFSSCLFLLYVADKVWSAGDSKTLTEKMCPILLKRACKVLCSGREIEPEMSFFIG